MTKNEIKKEIYKRQGCAELVKIIKGVAVYKYEGFTTEIPNLYFNVPMYDMGDAEFLPWMPAKLLLRHLQTN